MLFQFNLYSALLLVFFVHGGVYAFLLLARYARGGHASEGWLGAFLLLCILYIFPWMSGFAGWYDTQPYRDILFYIPFQHLLFIGPVVYFYTCSLVNPAFKVRGRNMLHLLPGFLYLVYAGIVVVTDKLVLRYPFFLAGGTDPDFDNWYQVLGFAGMLLYTALSYRYYRMFRNMFVQVVSYADRFRFTHVRNFLPAFGAMLLLRVVFFIIGYFTGLDYQDTWWYFLGFAVLFYYMAITGYSTRPQTRIPFSMEATAGRPVYLLGSGSMLGDTDVLPLHFETRPQTDESLLALQEWKVKLENALQNGQAYEDPDLTLAALAKQLGTNASLLSKTINTCFGQNFNDYINRHRVEAVQQSMLKGEDAVTSLEGLGYRNGFNSKATFFRAFKKHTGLTPAAWLQQVRARP